jgi:hypothetical protein
MLFRCLSMHIYVSAPVDLALTYSTAVSSAPTAALHCRLTRGNTRRPGDLCWLTQYAWALLDAGEDLVVLEAFGSSSKGSTAAGAAAPALSGLELLRELVCSTASGADCKLVLDAPTAAAAGIALDYTKAGQVSC